MLGPATELVFVEEGPSVGAGNGNLRRYSAAELIDRGDETGGVERSSNCVTPSLLDCGLSWCRYVDDNCNERDGCSDSINGVQKPDQSMR